MIEFYFLQITKITNIKKLSFSDKWWWWLLEKNASSSKALLFLDVVAAKLGLVETVETLATVIGQAAFAHSACCAAASREPNLFVQFITTVVVVLFLLWR